MQSKKGSIDIITIIIAFSRTVARFSFPLERVAGRLKLLVSLWTFCDERVISPYLYLLLGLCVIGLKGSDRGPSQNHRMIGP